MWTLMVVLFWLAVAAGLLALYGHAAGRFLQLDAQHDALHFVTTSDGWRLAVSRYRPAQPLPGAPPVLLCPGLAWSGRLFNLGPRSLARTLAGQGYDVWVLDWRGRGQSDRPRLFGSRRRVWCFDDYVAFNLPAVLEALQAQTGSPRVLGVGVGLGGLALLAAAVGPAGARLAGIATLGTSAHFRRATGAVSTWSLRLLGRLRVEALVRLAAPLLGRVTPRPLAALQNRDAIEPAIYRRALVNAASSPSPRELRQLEDWLRSDLCMGLAEDRDYRRQLAQVSVPVLLMAGIRDQLAPPEAIEQMAALLASADREVLQASRLQGMATNYGHLDLLIGANVARDIYPHLVRWLDAHCGVAVPAGRPEPPRGEIAWPAVTPASAPVLPATTVPAVTAAPPEREPEPELGPLFSAEQAEADAEQAGTADDQMDWLDGDVPHVPRPTEK